MAFDLARRISSSQKTIGQIYKEESDLLMEQTWDNDIQSKVCYIYDYKHDDQPHLKDHITHENTTKTKIDAKFIITSYGSISKDQVAYHLMFRPSEKLEFEEGDEMYYFETDYRKPYNMSYPCGLFVDLPNEKGVYEKWIIINEEQGNQFIKYNILPCNYRFEWIEVEGNNSYKRRMWGCDRQQLSYTGGVWIDRYMNSLDNVSKAFLPLNPITENINYIGENNENQRMIISAKTKHPLAWKLTKLENTKPLGVLQLTLTQSSFDQHKDYIEKDEDGNIIGMWADYWISSIEPIPDNQEDIKPSPIVSANISSTTNTIKVGGSYKTLTVNLLDSSSEDVTNTFSTATYDWKCNIDGDDLTTIVFWSSGNNFNKQKIKFPNDRDYLGKILTITCTITDGLGNTFEALKEFELIV